MNQDILQNVTKGFFGFFFVFHQEVFVSFYYVMTVALMIFVEAAQMS